MKKELFDFLFRDVKSENETKRIAVLLRLNIIVMWFYFLLLIGVFVIAGCPAEACAAAGCFALSCLVFYLTYQDATKPAVLLCHATTLFWILFCVFLIGWDSGVQHFIFMLIMLVFLTSLSPIGWKIFYSALLCALRLFLYVYTLHIPPLTQLSPQMGIAFQFINTIAICSMIIVSLCLHNNDSNEMEQKLISYNDKLHRLALIDPLTELYNRRGILEYLTEKASDYTQEKVSNLCVGMSDIDFFKKINDQYGHECGDLVLREISALFSTITQGKGRVGRWGGEEFLFVLPNINGDEACVFFEKVRATIRSLPITYQGEAVTVTLTYGVVEYDYRENVDYSIKEADKKLYLGKEMGRNRVVY